MLVCRWRNASDGIEPWRHAACLKVTYHTPKGVLGHEWDEVVDNGWSPPNLQKLVYYGRQCPMLTRTGAVFDSCSATHNLVLSRHEESGAWTFGSGTVQWSWALDDRMASKRASAK